MSKQLKALLDYSLGCMTGFVSTWAISGLTGAHLLFSRPNTPHGPIRALWDLTGFYILHGGNTVLCWVLLFLFAIAMNLLLILFSKPIHNHRYFVAGLVGASVSVLGFVIYCNLEPCYLMAYIGSKGSLTWIAMQHHITPFWAMKDQVELLSLLNKFVEHMDVLLSLLGLPLLVVLINDVGKVRTGAKSEGESKLDSAVNPASEEKIKVGFSGRAALLTVALVVLPVASIFAAGGIGLPEPEPTLYSIKIFVVKKDVTKGQIISEEAVSASELNHCLDPDPNEFVQTSPVGKKANYDLSEGQIFCVKDVSSVSP